MEGIAAEVSQKLKSAIKAKLMELGAYVDDELSNYVMVMVTNRRSKAEMDRELQLFLGGNTSAFTSWLQSVWMKLEQVTVTNSGIDNTKRKKKIKKGTKSSSESEDDKKPKKKRKVSASDPVGKEVKKRKATKATTAAVVKSEFFSEENLSDIDTKPAPATVAKKNKITDLSSSIDEDDFLNIKEDFESEFLSDCETFEPPIKSTKPIVVEPPPPKKSLLPKSDSSEKLPVAQPAADKKQLSGRHLKETPTEVAAKEPAAVGRRLTPPETAKPASGLSKLVLKNLTAATTANEQKSAAAAEKASASAATRKALVREQRKPPPSRSRSKTPTAVIPRSKSRSPAPPASKTTTIRQRSRSRLRSPSPPSSSPPRTVKRVRGAARDSRSPPPARAANQSAIVLKSRSRSPVSAKYASLGDKSSAVVDARELINRKRAALVSANEHKEEKAKRHQQQQQLMSAAAARKHDLVVDVDDGLAGGKQRSAISRLKPSTERLKGTRERLKENVNAAMAAAAAGNSRVPAADVDDEEEEEEEPAKDEDDHEPDSDPESGNERLNHNSSAAGSDRDDDADDDDDEDAYFDKNEKKKKFGRFVVSQQGGTRSVTMRSALEKKAAGKTEKADMRSIRRTVYSDDGAERDASDEQPEADEANDEDDELKNNKDDKVKKRKSMMMNQIVKYIKDDPQGNTTSGKIVKVSTRPKMANVPAASSTLIRKAMAEAHKSMSNIKEESLKKKEQHDSTALNSNSRISEERTMTVDNDLSDSGEPVITDENEASSEEVTMDAADMEYNPEDQINHSRDGDVAMDSTEEYDPSKNIPQFVVTLTGLDPKLFPNDDIDMADIDPMMDDIRLKPRSQERCKYYPNCLAGSQCLYYHPVIPCKMFPNCKYGNNCLYIHPKCKYDSSCTRYDCTFLHTSPRILPPVPARHPVASGSMNQPCKYYYNCTNPVCPYLHPKICRFDRFCTNKHCTFSHTSLSHVGSHVGGAHANNQFHFSKLKWCRPKDGGNEKNAANSEIDAAVEN